MKYKGKAKIKALIAVGLLAMNLSGCKKEIKGYINPPQETTVEDNKGKYIEYDYQISSSTYTSKEMEEFKKKLQEDFSKFNVTLDKASDEFVSSITIDGTNVSIELTDGSIVSGDLYNLEISDVTFENFYIYDSQFIDDLYNVEEKYPDYTENGYDSPINELYDDYDSHTKLNLTTENCSVNNEYKEGDYRDIKWIDEIDFSNCRSLWLKYFDIKENQFSSMPNLETLVLVKPFLAFLDEEVIKIQSNSLKNIIIDGQTSMDCVDHFDFTGCPNLEIVSIPNDSQETNLNGLKGLKNLKVVAFGLPANKAYNLNEKVLDDFQDRIDLVSKPFPTDDASLAYPLNNFISDISGINGSGIEILNISFLKCVSSDMLLETVKSLPNLKQIVGFEINNAGMCSDELIKYCEEHGVKHPFTEKSVEIKHKLQKIVSSVITEDMNEEEKINALSEYIINNMEYNFDLIDYTDESSERIEKGWGECLYYSVIEGEGVCQGYAMYAQNLFTEAGITSYKIEGTGHTWNLVQIDDEYYFVDLTVVDKLINEEKSSSFEDCNLDSYYLVPVDEECSFYPLELPNEVEEYNREKEERESSRMEGLELGSYMVQTSRQELCPKSYSKFYGIIGILCALGLAKKVLSKEKMHKKGQSVEKLETLENREGVKKVSSLYELLNTLKRNQKLDELRNKRNIAAEERIKNKKAKELEMQANQMNKGANIR